MSKTGFHQVKSTYSILIQRMNSKNGISIQILSMEVCNDTLWNFLLHRFECQNFLMQRSCWASCTLKTNEGTHAFYIPGLSTASLEIKDVGNTSSCTTGL